MQTKRTIRNCETVFRFQCPKLWEQLALTESPGVRHCSACDRNVYFCVTDEETIEHAKAGRRPGIARRATTRYRDPVGSCSPRRTTR